MQRLARLEEQVVPFVSVWVLSPRSDKKRWSSSPHACFYLLSPPDTLCVLSSGRPVGQSSAVDHRLTKICGLCSKGCTNTKWPNSVGWLAFLNHKCGWQRLPFIPPCSFRRRRGLRPNHQHDQDRRTAPCGSPTVKLPWRQSHTLPCAGGECPVGGI